MRILLLRPVPGNERFGLGPFFRIEPLGMEYIAAALETAGYRVTLVDLRFACHCLYSKRASDYRTSTHDRQAAGMRLIPHGDRKDTDTVCL